MDSEQPPGSSTPPAESGSGPPTAPATRVTVAVATSSAPWPQSPIGARPEDSSTQAEGKTTNRNQPPRSSSADSGGGSPTPPTVSARGETPQPSSPVRTSLDESAAQAKKDWTNYKTVASTLPHDEPSRSARKNVGTSVTATKEGGSTVDSPTIAAQPTQTASNPPTAAPAVLAVASGGPPPTSPEAPKNEVFLSPELTPEKCSVYVTAAETGGVEGWLQKLRGKFLKPDSSRAEEVTPRSPTGRGSADEGEKMAGQSKVQFATQAPPNTPIGAVYTEGQSCGAPGSQSIDVTAQAMEVAPRSLTELVDIAGAQGKEFLPSRSRSKILISPDQELRRTTSKFADWPKHKLDIIPDPELAALQNYVTREVKDETPSAAPRDRRPSLLLRTAQLFGRKQSDQPVHWEPVFASKAKNTASSKAKSGQKPPAESSSTGTSTHDMLDRYHKVTEPTDLLSEDPLENVLESRTCLYSLESMLNIDKDLVRRASLFPRRRSEIPSTPQKDQFTGTMAVLLTRSASAAHTDVIVTATPRRYWILFMFCVLSMVNAFQWIQYAIIASVLADHYGVSEIAISWTSMLYLIGYMILAFPSAWILDNLGLRVTVLLGAAGTAIGACVKTYAVRPGQFNIVLIGQAFPALAQAFILGVPPRLASAWFRYEEVSTACSLGVLGNNLGIALGFVIPPNIVDAHNASTALLYLCIVVTIVSCVCLVVITVSFQDRPEHPPSFSEMLSRTSSTKVSFAKTFTTLIKDRNFLLLLGSYGLNTGAFYSISTLLNPVILVYFPGEEPFAGWLGLALIVAGLVGSWICGTTLDKTGKYKEVTLATYVLSTLGLFVYTFLLSAKSHVLSIVACVFLGFFMTGYLPIGLQLAAEITYPMPEGMSSNMMNVSAQAIGFVMIFVSGYLQETFGDITSNLCLVASLLVGSIMTTCIKAELKRQQAIRRESTRRSSSTISGKASHH